MIYESLPHIILPKIGFGTAGFGGRLMPNFRRDKHFLAILRSALELGYTHFDTAEFYALGHSEELLGRAIRDLNISRECLFMTTKVWPINLNYHRLLGACERSLRRLKMEYIDLYLIHIPNYFVPLSETFRALNQLVKQGKVKYIGVSNFKMHLLREAQGLAESPIVTNQIPYSLFERAYLKAGIIDYCREKDILITAYSPLRHQNVKSNKTVVAIANEHGATPHQIALAWLVTQNRVIAIPTSQDPNHQKENLEAVNIILSEAEIEQLNNLEHGIGS